MVGMLWVLNPELLGRNDYRPSDFAWLNVGRSRHPFRQLHTSEHLNIAYCHVPSTVASAQSYLVIVAANSVPPFVRFVNTMHVNITLVNAVANFNPASNASFFARLSLLNGFDC